MFGWSLDAWNVLRVVFLVLTAIGAAGGVISTIAINSIQKKNAKDAADSLARYQASAGKSIAEANARAAEAELRTQELRAKVAPRILKYAQFKQALSGQPTGRVEIIYLGHDPECMMLAQGIGQVLREIGWEVVGSSPLVQNRQGRPEDRDLPDMMTVGGQPAGVTLVTNSISEAEADVGMLHMQNKPWVRTAYTVLYVALLDNLGTLKASVGSSKSPVPGTIRITVAPKENLNP